MNGRPQLPPRLSWEFRFVAVPTITAEPGSVDAIADVDSVQATLTDAGELGFQVVCAGNNYILLGRVTGILDAPGDGAGVVGATLTPTFEARRRR